MQVRILSRLQIKFFKYSQVAELVDAHRQVILIEGTAAVEATINTNTGSNPVLTT